MKRIKFSFIVILLCIVSLTAFAQKVQYKCGDPGVPLDNHIKSHFNIINTTSGEISLSVLTIRYYYTEDTTADQMFNVDWAAIGGGNVTGTFYDGYVEVGFLQSAGYILPGNETGNIEIRINKIDWSNYNETDDYSYKGDIVSFTDSDTITLYRNSSLVWGLEPGGQATEEPIIEPAEDPTPEAGTGAFLETAGMIVMEAESYSTKADGIGSYSGISWTGQTDAGASSGTYMLASPNSGINSANSLDAPVMEYDINLTSNNAVWYVWVCRRGTSASDDSCGTSIDSGSKYEWHYGTSSTFTWTRSGQNYNILSGYHTFKLWMREDGAAVDKIILTTDNNFTPSGMGPDESPREGGATPESTLEPTLEPTLVTTPDPTSEPGVQALKIQYKAGDLISDDMHIKPHVKIANTGATTVTLSDVTFRYYYSKEGTADEEYVLDFAAINGNYITGTFFDGYLEMGFTSEAGSLAPGTDTGEIMIRFNKVDWSNYDETDDYSYNVSLLSYTDWDKITLYVGGILVWGIEPDGSTPIPTLEPTLEPTPDPTPIPTDEPTPDPTPIPTDEPTPDPTPIPTDEPTPDPTPIPTVEPTVEPTPEPTTEPGVVLTSADFESGFGEWVNVTGDT
ncbi:MAG: hypothetical protein JXJ04_15825, partial [Spirochaetales bacterium]|nr:hypothetical protein [Spirochaetales bacterium]